MTRLESNKYFSRQQQRTPGSFRRRNRRRLRHEALESRIVLDGSGFPGNACPPDLNLSAIPTQTAHVGEELTLDLFALGATVDDVDADGNPTGNAIRLVLDPDVPDDTPVGATLTSAGVFRWTPTAQQMGTFQFVVIAIDQGTPPLADAEVFTVEVVNRPPMIDLNGPDTGIDFSATFTEDGGPVAAVGSNLTVSDADGTTLASATVRITNLLDGASESLMVDTSGTSIVASYDSATGILQLTGVDSADNYQMVLRTLHYDNTSQNPDTTDRQIEVIVNDGMEVSAPAVSTMRIVAVNDAPNLTAIPDQQVTLGQTLEFTVTATDVDSSDLTFLIDRDDPGASLPANVTLVAVDGTSATFRWVTDMAVVPGDYRFSILVVDMGADALADREVFIVTVVDQRPVLDLNGSDAGGIDFAATFTEDGGPVALVDTDMSLSDADDTELQSATVTITNLQDGAAESLAVETTGTNIAAQYDAQTGVLSLTGTDTLENYRAVLASLVYDNTSQDPGTTLRIIEVTVSDGDAPSLPATVMLTVVSVNDAPSLTLPAPYHDDTTAVPVTVGQTIEFAAVASDIDDAEGDLTFTLDLSTSGLPAGAAIPTISSPPGSLPGGDFAWTPDTTGTFTITVIVTDAGGLAAQRSFTVDVQAAASASPLPTEDIKAVGTVAAADDETDVWHRWALLDAVFADA